MNAVFSLAKCKQLIKLTGTKENTLGAKNRLPLPSPGKTSAVNGGVLD